MRLLYLDAGLSGELGHFAGICRVAVRAFREQGVEVAVFGNKIMLPSLVTELGAQPLFRARPASRESTDPVCGWLVDFLGTAKFTKEDLSRINGIGTTDVLFYNIGSAAQIMALVEWLQESFSPEAAPRVVISVGWPAGVVVTKRDFDGTPTSWDFSDENAHVAYRFAYSRLAPPYRKAVRLVSQCPVAARSYSALINGPVETIPEYPRVTAYRDRRGAKSPNIVFLGEQRPAKGGDLLLPIVKGILALPFPATVLVHDSRPELSEQLVQLGQISATDGRLKVQAGAVAGGDWNELLSKSDLVVLPYDRNTYSAMPSGISLEAIANAIPQVVPADTALSWWLRDYGNPGIAFEGEGSATVVEAVATALRSYDRLAEAAVAASRRWRERNSPEKLVSAIMRG
jgi:hypothetical protein